jgi:L-fucose isomerase-like protein
VARCSVVATARRTFAVDTGRKLAVAAHDVLADVLAVHGTGEPVLSLDAAAAVELDPDADLHVLLCATFADASMAVRMLGAATAPVLLWAFREPGRTGERLWLNSLCGANLAAHALVERGVRVHLLYGNPDEPAVRDRLMTFVATGITEPAAPAPPVAAGADDVAVRKALAELRGTRIGLVGDAPDGFTPCAADPAALDKLLGIELIDVELADVLAAAGAVPEAAAQAEVADVARRSPSVLGVDPEQANRAFATTAALRTLSRSAGAGALAVRCWPEFPVEYGACLCSALGRLHDEGTPAACERDVDGAATMLLAGALGAEASYLMDLVELDSAANVVRFWHCGSAPPSLAADPADVEQGRHCNRHLGVAGNFALRPGRVTITRLSRSGENYRLLLTGGEALPAPNRYQGNTAEVRLDAPAERFVHDLVDLGFEHHTVLAWTDLRPQLRSAARLMGIPVYEW